MRHAFWTQNQPWSGLRSFAVPRLFRLLHSALMLTARFSTTGMHRLRPFLDDPQKGALLVLWHDHTLIPLHFFRDCGIGTMMSTSRAGQMQAAFWRLYGWPVVWGSTKKKEGIAALRETMRIVGEGGIFGFTPDGPKGPRREAHGGAVYIASKTGAPILPISVAASHFWQLPTWDRFLIPKPFARVHIHLGAALQIPPELSRAQSEIWREKIKAALDEAEQIAQKELVAGSASTDSEKKPFDTSSARA